MQAVRTALAAVPAGAAVLPAERVSDAPGPRGRRSALGFVAWLHLPALAVPERHAFVPTLFATPGHQPLRVLGPWTGIAAQQGQPVPFGFLAGFGPSTNWQYLAGYAQHWRTRFDYVLLLNADLPPAEAEPVLPELDLVTDAGFARLYRIRRDGR